MNPTPRSSLFAFSLPLLLSGCCCIVGGDDGDDGPDVAALRAEAIEQEQAGDLDDACELWGEVEQLTRDPDAMQAWARLLVAQGKAQEEIARLTATDPNGYPTDPQARMRRGLLRLRTGDDRNGKEDLGYVARGVNREGEQSPASSEAHLLLGDWSFERKEWSDAAWEYRCGTRKMRATSRLHWSLGQLRQARALLAYGEPDVALRKLAAVDRADLPAPPLGAPSLDEVAAQVAQAERERVVRERQAAPAPSEASLCAALGAAKGVTITQEGESYVLAGPNGCEIRWPTSFEGEASFCVPSPGLPSQKTFSFAIPAGRDALAERWDARRQCFVFAAPGKEVWELRVLLFPNGDLFAGYDRFIDEGLYLSSERPAQWTTCCFGAPPEKALAVAKIRSRNLVKGSADGRVELDADLGDGARFVGQGYLDGERLLPLGYGRIEYPGRGVLFAKFKAGRATEGAFADVDGRIAVVQDGAPRADTNDFDTYEFGESEYLRDMGDAFEYFDASTGVALAWDRLFGFFTSVDAERFARSQRRREATASIEKERVAREEAARARHAEVEAEIAEWKREHPEEARESESGGGAAFDFLGSLEQRDPRCIRCGGAGAVYVPGGASQQLVWRTGDGGSGHWADATVHYSGEMATCHWCGGTGLR